MKGQKRFIKPGARFGRLKVLFELEKHDNRREFLCQCDCGKECTRKLDYMLSGQSVSCGCYRHDALIARQTKHSMTKTRFYKIFTHVKVRTKNPNSPAYQKWYGAKGIRCLWCSFEQFYADMYPSYVQHVYEFGEKNTSLDRIDTKGHYCKENCRWATTMVQGHNRASCHFITYNGERLTVTGWAKKVGLSPETLRHRIKGGWNEIEAITTPINEHYSNISKKRRS